jgi:hypothetical protein
MQHNDTRHNAEYCYAERPLMPSVIYKYCMLSDVMLNVIMLRVVMLSVVAP